MQSQMHDMIDAMLAVSYAGLVAILGAENHLGWFTGSGWLPEVQPEGDGSMSAVLETSDRHVDSVSVLVDPFWATFMFRIFASGKFYGIGQLSDSAIGEGRFDVL